MGRIVEIAPSISFDEIIATKGANYRPDFRILTAGIESDRTNDHLVHMVGSSTEKDLQGDTMSVLALNSMTKAASNLTVWLNHNYDLPDSIFGSIQQTPMIYHKDGIADLHLAVDVEMENPNAAKVKRYIDNGRRLGCSIGCMVTKYEVPDQDEESSLEMFAMQPIIIHDVYVVEYSIVGIPANQRSWVENAIRGVFTRTLDKSLVPAMKALWPSVYKDAVKNIASDTVRKSYDAMPARPRTDTRLDWYTGNKTFVFSSQKSGHREMSRESVQGLLNGTLHVIDGKELRIEPETELGDDLKALHIEDATVTEKGAIPNEINPYGDVDGTGAINNSKGPMDNEGLIMLHKDGINHDAWEGQHTHEHDAFGYGGLVTHSHVHTHLNDNNHNHDNSVDLEGKEKKMDPQKKADATHAINKDGSEGLLLKAGGDHESYKGVHTHHHDSFGHGDVDAHLHEHFHGSDNNHEHDHSHTAMGEKADHYYAGEPGVTRAINKDGSEGLLLKAGGDHEPYKGTHSHTHDAVGHGDNDVHNHEHSHDGDNAHGHDHKGVPTKSDARTDDQKADDDEDATDGGKDEKTEKKLDPVRAQFLASYNTFGATLGLPEVTVEMLTRAEHPAVKKDIEPAMLQQLQSIHDTVANASGGMVCANVGVASTGQQMGTDAAGQLSVINGLSVNMALFAKSLDSLGDVLALKKDAETTRDTIAVAKKELDAIFAGVKQAAATLDTLKAMPLGNPTHQARTVVASDGTTTHEELLGVAKAKSGPVAADSLSQALALTELKQVDLRNGQVMRYRSWPAGVGGSIEKGVRPPLTSNQIQFMEFADIAAYREGSAANVPYIDNQIV